MKRSPPLPRHSIPGRAQVWFGSQRGGQITRTPACQTRQDAGPTTGPGTKQGWTDRIMRVSEGDTAFNRINSEPIRAARRVNAAKMPNHRSSAARWTFRVSVHFRASTRLNAMSC